MRVVGLTFVCTRRDRDLGVRVELAAKRSRVCICNRLLQAWSTLNDCEIVSRDTAC